MKQRDREIFRLAWPNIISNVSVPLLSSVDTALMGYLSAEHLGAVGLGSMIFNFFYWNFGFLRMGTTGMTAQSYGARNKPEITAVFFRALIVSTLIAILIIVFQNPIVDLGVVAMNATDTQADLVKAYVLTRIWAAPATLGLYVLMGWLLGLQNAVIPMLVTIAINLINIALSYYLIIVMGYGIRGVALGTVIAQYFGLILVLILIAVYFKKYLPRLPFSRIVEWSAYKKFFLINRDIFIRTLCLTFAFAFFYSQSSKYGEILLGVNVVLLQFLNWMSYGIDGFAYAAESLVGKYKGAQDFKILDQTIRRVFLWSSVMAVGYALLYGLGGDLLFRIFTDVDQVIQAAGPYLLWMALLPIVGFASYIWDGVFVGLTASKAMRNSMLLSLLVYLICYYTLEPHYGVNALWTSLAAFLLARGLFQHYLFYRKGYELA
ncbi:MAG: MATE family efflux transporter [Saprospiraceae bacterium]|nr:MATE family efflux transporter [Saprospiraceae bacterium]